MQVSEGMSTVVLTVGPNHTLREAAQAMAQRKVGAAIVIDPELPGPGIITERDMLKAVASGADLDDARVERHLTGQLVIARPDWSLEQAAAEMVRGGFRHLVVVDDAGEISGILSVRDIVRCWTGDGATSGMPAGSA